MLQTSTIGSLARLNSVKAASDLDAPALEYTLAVGNYNRGTVPLEG